MATPSKSRKPKTPEGCQAGWRSTLGWRFRACPSIDGKRVFGPWRGTRDEARTDYIDLRARAEQIAETLELIDFEEGLRLFLERAEQRGFQRMVQPCREGTMRHYREICRTLFHRITPTTLLNDIDTLAVSTYLHTRATESRTKCKCIERGDDCTHEARTPSPSRLNKERMVLYLIFKTAIDAGKHPGPNPVDEVERWGDESEEAPHYNVEQVGRILSVIRGNGGRCPTAERFADVVALLFLTGLRIGELGYLQRKHVDLKAGTLQVPQGKTGARTIPIQAPHITILRRMADGLTPDGFLLRGDTHAQRTQNLKSNDFRRWRSKLPEEFQPGFHAHTFRHSFQTHLLESGSAVHLVKALMGHSRKRDVHDRYAHASLFSLRQAMARSFDSFAPEATPPIQEQFRDAK